MSEVYKTRACKVLLFAGCVLLFAGASTVNAEENIIGDWVFTMEMPDMGMGMAMNMKINSTFSKGTDGAITGTWQMVFEMPEGMGPGPGGPGAGGPGGDMGGMPPMPTMKVVDVKIDGQKLTFTQKMEGGDAGMGMGDFSQKFTGTIKGDAIEGKMAMEGGGDMGMGPMEFTLKGARKAAGAATTTAAAATGLEGEWEFVTIFGDMGMEIKAKAVFKKGADAKYTCTWESVPTEGMGGMGDMPAVKVVISDIKLDGEKLTFVQKVDLSAMQMGEMTSKFAGTLKGDKIEGALTSDMGESKSVGTRKKSAAAVVSTAAAGGDALTGNWELKLNTGDTGMGAPSEFTINSTITKSADGKYAMTWEQVGDAGGMGQIVAKNEDIKLDGQNLTFVHKVTIMDMEMAYKFTGTVKDNVMNGKLAGTGGGDMGMPAMELTLTGKKK
ncbi:MAG: hypothetical protein JW787_07245 [Sedimentisphaerales bacterium]|nr:hypothetical protein [Sedimentisphaerales bacterium]